MSSWLVDPVRITEHAVLRALAAGFALVLLLLGVAGIVAVRSTKAIEVDAAQVGKEQIAMARLLNDAQAGQNTMAAILHQLAQSKDNIDRNALLRELEAADKALAKVAESAAETPEAMRWQELMSAVRRFSSGVRDAVHRGDQLRPGDLVLLFNQHDRVVELEQQLLESIEQRIENTERRIEAESRDLAKNARLLLGTCIGLASLCAILTLTFARTSIRKIEWQASELSRVSWHMLQSQETLARRFSHELHDELGQSLAAVKANLSARHGAGDWEQRRGDTMKLVDGAIANVRDLSQLLHPVILDDFGLNAGLRWLTEGFGQRTGIGVDYATSFDGRLGEEVETHLFRITQEALTNVARHSGATRVTVELHPDETGGAVVLSIEDNGRGLPKQNDPQRPSLGMTGMRARAQEVGAEFQILKPLENGVRVEVKVPLVGREKGSDAERQEDSHIAGR